MHFILRAFLVAHTVMNLPATQEIQFWPQGQVDPMKNRMAILCSIIAWRIPWTEATFYGVTKS